MPLAKKAQIAAEGNGEELSTVAIESQVQPTRSVHQHQLLQQRRSIAAAHNSQHASALFAKYLIA